MEHEQVAQPQQHPTAGDHEGGGLDEAERYPAPGVQEQDHGEEPGQPGVEPRNEGVARELHRDHDPEHGDADQKQHEVGTTLVQLHGSHRCGALYPAHSGPHRLPLTGGHPSSPPRPVLSGSKRFAPRDQRVAQLSPVFRSLSQPVRYGGPGARAQPVGASGPGSDARLRQAVIHSPATPHRSTAANPPYGPSQEDGRPARALRPTGRCCIMSVSDEDRTYLFTRIAEAIDDRAARTMSELFADAEGEDPGILARFDQQDAAIADLGARMGRLEERFDGLEQRFDGLEQRFDGLEQRFVGLGGEFEAFRHQMEGLLHREIGAAIAAQTRTVLVGILAVTASMFGMLLAMNQLL